VNGEVNAELGKVLEYFVPESLGRCDVVSNFTEDGYRVGRADRFQKRVLGFEVERVRALRGPLRFRLGRFRWVHVGNSVLFINPARSCLASALIGNSLKGSCGFSLGIPSI
jgi:hypothetical protein